MSVITKDLGVATAYGYAKSKGYTGTEEEFAELMASYADVAQQAEAAAQDAEDAKDAAVSAKNDAQSAQAAAAGSAQTASTKAAEASNSAQATAGSATAAGNSATAAAGSASTAQTAAQTATNKASEASSSASAASTAKTGAETARTGAQTAQAAAETAQENAEAAAASVSASAAQIEQNTADIGAIKNDFNDLKSALNLNVTWIDGGYINDSGTIYSNAAFKYTDFIEISDVFFKIGYTLYLTPNAFVVAMYDADKLYIANSGVNGSGNNTPKSGFVAYPSENNEQHIPKYIRFSHCKASAGVTNPEPIIYLADVTKPVITDDVISSSQLTKASVTKEKCAFIVHDPESNYINKTKYSNGYISASGTFVANNGWRATDYCELLPDTHYYGYGLHGGYCAFYKADKTVINAYGANSFTISSFTTPPETAYARFSLNASSQSVDTAWINVKNEKPDDYSYILDDVGVSDNTDNNPCNYDGLEIAVFNKILCVGDSMTEGTFNRLDSGSTQYVTYSKYSYPTYLHKMTGVDVTNLGHGGKTSVQWYNTEQNTDLSGYDCAIIQLGINDFGTYEELGTDTKTAFQNIITKLKTENKNIKIFVANIIPGMSYSSAGYKAYSASLLEWLETTYATDPSVIPVDIQQYGHTGDSEAYNAGHLTALGYRMLARDYIGFISDYIKNNGGVFREVQFIGTDYWYTNPNS